MMNTTDQFPPFEKLPAMKEMPDCTVDENGAKITGVDDWLKHREYLKALFSRYMYGHAPEDRGEVTGQVAAKSELFGGKAEDELLSLRFGKAKTVSMRARFVYPKTDHAVPVIIAAMDNHKKDPPLLEEMVCRYGFGIFLFNRNDLCPDAAFIKFLRDYRAGVFKGEDRVKTMIAEIDQDGSYNDYKLTPDGKKAVSVAEEAYPGFDWGVIVQWGFGYLIAADCLEARPEADKNKLVYTGHSRLGKSALWAGIYDDRAQIVAPNASGCGGVGSFRFLGGHENIRQDPKICETIGNITTAFPEWFCETFRTFGDVKQFPLKEQHLPFDANTLRAAVAPRAVFSTEAMSDDWSNPCGTQFAWEDAQKLYDLLGIPEKNGFHYREGGHDQNAEDMKALLTYCDFLFNGKPLTDDINRKRFNR